VIVLFCIIFCTALMSASRNLHKPMHIFLCNLVVSDAIGCTSSVPKQLHVILTGDTQIFYSSCIVQMFWIHFFSISEIFTLTVIATIVICTLAAVIAGSQTILIIPLKLKDKDREVDGIHCDNMGILKLSASDTRINESYGSALIVVDVVALGIIGYTYFKIIVECKKSRLNQARNKSIETLITHFLALSIFFVAIFVAILVPRFIKKTEDSASRNIKSASQLAVFVVPIANVTIYLFRTKALKKAIVFHCHRLMLVF
uniref:G-protein coupled receptors family 1 profile domain-containing protein n=1 Tax=Petromyzon marinus TaxID=7757 RepID=S4RPP4_PETMA